ncbi:MAG: hypothetical protein M3Y72_14500 [Acidobacteriota bacterium]|nr:hypothetical protein [Acidobacteriota bacterium]
MSKRYASLLLSVFIGPVIVHAADDTQKIAVADKLQIPGGTLKSGSYTFSVEDRLPDRAIVRISSDSSDKRYLLLTVPNSKLAADSASQLLYFGTNSGNKDALKAWKCPTCSAPLEFVYPKLEAVKITDASTEPVLAVDPTYDKLPSNLSADDMKVVTLWLLSPERITADNVGVGVKAAKYTPDTAPAAETASAPAAETASAPAVSQPPATVPSPAPVSPTPTPEPTVSASNTAPVQTASAAPSSTNESISAPLERAPGARNQLPKTASNTYTFLLCGIGCFAAALALRFKRATAAV